jgi:hypothetical protein
MATQKTKKRSPMDEALLQAQLIANQVARESLAVQVAKTQLLKTVGTLASVAAQWLKEQTLHP